MTLIEKKKSVKEDEDLGYIEFASLLDSYFSQRKVTSIHVVMKGFAILSASHGFKFMPNPAFFLIKDESGKTAFSFKDSPGNEYIRMRDSLTCRCPGKFVLTFSVQFN